MFLCALLVSQVSWGIEIPFKCRVLNWHPGYCTWASIETLGAVHGIKELDMLVKNRSDEMDEYYQNDKGEWICYKKNVGWDYAVTNKLNSLKIKFINQKHDNYNRRLLEKYANKYGCVVTIKGDEKGNGVSVSDHSIVVTKYCDTQVTFFDSNRPAHMYVASRAWFDYWWAGNTIVIFKNWPPDFISVK